jgi:uncharacterized membrane protein YdjX (TVP38/TMEM64 family)
MANPRTKRVIGIIGILFFAGFIIIISYIFVTRFGEITENPQRIREIVRGYGVWGYFIFSLLNIFQVIFAPVPGNVVTVSSGILFGFLRGIIITWLSVIAGGSIVLVIARAFGRRMFEYLLDEKAQNFENVITRKGVPFILLLSIFPNPLGDGLFYLAGLTTIPLKVLIPLIALGRLPGIVLAVFLGDRLLTAGIAGWLLAGLGFLVVVVLYLMLGKRIEKLFEKIIITPHAS